MLNKTYKEIKTDILYCSQQLNCEQQMQTVFVALEKNIPNIHKFQEQEIKTNIFKTSFSLGYVQEFQSCIQTYNNLPKRRKSEQQTRLTILQSAERQGIPKEDVLKILNKYDAALKTANSELERQQISSMGAAEIHKLLGARGALIVNGVEIIPAQDDFEEQNNNKFTKLE